MKLFYPCKIHQEDGIFYANFVDFPNCFTDGETIDLIRNKVNQQAVKKRTSAFRTDSLSNGQ